MSEPHCETSCREDILKKLNECVEVGGVWKFIGVFVTVLIFSGGVAMSIHAEGMNRMERRHAQAEQQIMTNTVAIARIIQTLEGLKEGQAKLEVKLESFGKEIIKEVKKSR